MFQLQQHPTINRVVVGCEANSSQQSPSTDSMPVCKIRSEISSLRDTLEEVTQKGKKYWEISTETDLDEAIQFFTVIVDLNEVQNSVLISAMFQKSVNLLRERKQLIPQLIDYNDRRKDPGQSDMSKEEIKEDLVGCQLLYDEAADRYLNHITLQ